jgi:hypothetical protein
MRVTAAAGRVFGPVAQAERGTRTQRGSRRAADPTGRVRFSNVFAPELESDLPADLLVLALGRIPDRALVESLAGASR